MALEPDNIHKSDIEALKNNVAWRWMLHEWEEILDELEGTLVVQDYPEVYRTQGRVSALAEMITTLDKLEDMINGL